MRNSVFLVALAATALSSPAQAADLLFDLDTVEGPDYSFILDSNPTPDFFGEELFVIGDVTVMPVGLQDLEFFVFFAGGGLSFSGVFDAFGPQLFDGSTSNPAFAPGQFVLTNADASPFGFLTISEAVAPVPEPATWAMMLLGFFGIGALQRRAGRVRSTEVAFN